jgi:hypothetical protein
VAAEAFFPEERQYPRREQKLGVARTNLGPARLLTTCLAVGRHYRNAQEEDERWPSELS